MKKNSHLILIIFLLLSNSIAAQDVVFSGYVFDRDTNEPLPNASIGIINRSIGTVANSVGEFEFFIPASFSNDTVFVSFVGYKSFKYRVGDLKNITNRSFRLESEPVMLAEVTVSAGQKEPRQIVEEALKAVSKVYPDQPYLMKAFQRSWEKVDFVDSVLHPGKLLESSAVIYDPGYSLKKSNKNNEEVYFEQLRRTKLTEGWVNDGSMEDMSKEVFFRLLHDNQVKYQGDVARFFLEGFLKFPNNLVYTLESTTKFDDEYVNIIKVDVPKGRALSLPASYRLFISQDDYAIIRFELHGTQAVTLSGPAYQTTQLDYIYTFRRFNERVYLNYARIQYTLNRVDPAKKKLLQIEDYYMELLINDLITSEVAEKRKVYMKAAKNPPDSYNKEFWKNYNAIKDNPLDKAIISIFENGEKLESQFEKANYKKVKKKDIGN